MHDDFFRLLLYRMIEMVSRSRSTSRWSTATSRCLHNSLRNPVVLFKLQTRLLSYPFSSYGDASTTVHDAAVRYTYQKTWQGLDSLHALSETQDQVSSEDPDRSHNSPCERCTKKHLKCEYVPVDGSAPATSPSPPAIAHTHWPNNPCTPTIQPNSAPGYPQSNMVRPEAVPSPYISHNNPNHTEFRLGYEHPSYYQSGNTGRDMGVFASDSWPRPRFYPNEMDVYMDPGAAAYNQGLLFTPGVEHRWSSGVNGHGNSYVAETHRRHNCQGERCVGCNITHHG
ncbi:uncharacterized protein EV420DRAFT_457661 [Desarmillaria tabescens]|uniref:Zn(2)-C6 fungal-type domain-containing protein n=1 Tax=Armillaria tabescens TaxID=1929756 RepID=A0AA39NMC9_ARMTA|nr:uncharacterized protein EV420DRAFT_457661 [Desarmillaria tabescens]KAK0468310.1 hypothetical protein EV420DRAFT_457661 [Desarmillaria tabescens]